MTGESPGVAQYETPHCGDRRPRADFCV